MWKFNWEQIFRDDDVPAAMAFIILVVTVIVSVIGLAIKVSLWFFLLAPIISLYIIYSRGYITRD